MNIHVHWHIVVVSDYSADSALFYLPAFLKIRSVFFIKKTKIRGTQTDEIKTWLL